MAKLSKKITSNIYELVNRIRPGISKNTSYDEAWAIFAEYGNIEGDIITDVTGTTKFNIYNKNEQIVATLSWDNVFIEEEGNWDWTTIYKDVIDYIFKHKIIKRPRAQKRETKTKPDPKPIVTPIVQNESIDVLKKKKSSLYQKIREWTKKGKDTSELVKEYEQISIALKQAK